MTQPLVSIITASYNQGRFIEDTLRSVRDQDYPHIEHIVIDGASTDQTVDILKRYEGTYPMRWISKPDRGHADALCNGFRQANGEILAWLNSDDVYLPGAIRRVVDTFQRHPDTDLVHGDIWGIDAEGRLLSKRRLTLLDTYDFVGQGNCLAQPATFWTRRIYDRVGGIDSRYYFQMDLEFFIRVAAVGRLRHLRAYLAKMRLHPDGKMVKAEQIRLKELGELQQLYLTREGARDLWGLRYTRPFLLSRQFMRFALQGDFLYASRKVWQRVWDGRLFRESRR